MCNLRSQVCILALLVTLVLDGVRRLILVLGTLNPTTKVVDSVLVQWALKVKGHSFIHEPVTLVELP